MATINLAGSTSGTISLAATAIAGSNTLTVPAETSTLATQAYVTTALPAAATQAQQETGTETTAYVSPGRQQYHPSATKAWVNFNGTGTPAIRASYNVSSITDNGTGDYTVNFTTGFSSANFSAVVTAGQNTVQWGIVMFSATTPFAVGACRIITNNPADAEVDPPYICAAFFGDQ